MKSVVHICITWVRGHTGIVGNERADELAKMAANSDVPLSYNLCPISYIKKLAKEHYMQEWNERWVNSDKGILTKELYFPTVYDRNKCKVITPNFVLTQFLTGHGKFGEYLNRFHIKDDATCICGEESQDVKHVLYDCPVFCRERYELELLLNTLNYTFTKPLTNILTNSKSYKYFMSFLNRIFVKL